MLDKVTPGEPFRPSAEERNTVVDLKADYARRRLPGGDFGGGVPSLDPSIVQVANGSGAARKQFEILGVGGTPPSEPGSADMREQVLLAGRTPTSADAAKFVILQSDAAADEVVEAVADGLCWCQVEIADPDHTRASAKDGSCAALISAKDGSATIEWREAGTSGTVWALVRLSGASAPAKPVRHGVIVNASSQLQPTHNRKWVGTVYAVETPGPTSDLTGSEPQLEIRVPHRSRPYADPDAAFTPSRFWLPDGSRIAFAAATDGTLVLVSDYDEWERFQIYYGKVVENQGAAHTRDNPSAVGLRKQVRLLVLDSTTGDPLAAPHAGKKVWVEIPPESVAAMKVDGIVAFRRTLGSPLNENLDIWANWDESTTKLIAVAGAPTALPSCVAIDCGLTVGTKEISDDHTGELRIRRGKTTPTDAAKRRRELRIGLSLRGRATQIAGKPDTARIKLPGLPPDQLESFFGVAGVTLPPNLSPVFHRHLVVEGANVSTTQGNWVELDWTAPGITGYAYFCDVGFAIPTGAGIFGAITWQRKWTLFDRGTAVGYGATNDSVSIQLGHNGSSVIYLPPQTTGSGSSPGFTQFTPRETTNEDWPNNCCEG
jgi:hypothetical protein